MQNQVFLGTDTPVVMNFSFTGNFSANGLSNFTDIKLFIGDEEYSTTLTPNNLFTTSNTELRLNIGVDTVLAARSYEVKIVGFSPTYDDGYVLVGCYRNSLTVKVVECTF